MPLVATLYRYLVPPVSARRQLAGVWEDVEGLWKEKPFQFPGPLTMQIYRARDDEWFAGDIPILPLPFFVRFTV
jgi:hypothetical protein